MRITLALLTALALLAPATAAQASRASDLAFEVSVVATGRAAEDTSLVQWSITRHTRAKVHVGKRTYRVKVAANTISNGGDAAEALRIVRDTYVAGAFIDRPLTVTEKRRWKARLVWIDGDVLAVNPANSLCTSGSTPQAAHDLFGTASTGWLYAPSGAFGTPEYLFGLHPPRGTGSGYGSAVQVVSERSALQAVANDPQAAAAVAWSGARDALASGAVCAAPLNGVTPSEATLRDGSYPATVPVFFAWSRRASDGGMPAYARRWYLDYLRGAKVRGILETGRARQRLLP